MGEPHNLGYEIVDCNFTWNMSNKFEESVKSNQLKLTNDSAAGYVYADCRMHYFHNRRDRRKVVSVKLVKTCRRPAMATIKLQLSCMDSKIRDISNWVDILSFESLSFKHESQTCVIYDSCSEKKHYEKFHDYLIEAECKIIWYGFVDQFYSPDSARFFMSYSENMEFFDLKIKVGNKYYPAHKVIMASRSSVLKKTLTTDMREFRENCIDLTDLGADAVQELLLFLYENRIDKAYNDYMLLLKLLRIGDMYDIPGLKNWCGMLLSNKLCEGDALMLLENAHIYKSPILQSRAIAFIITTKNNLFSGSNFEELGKRHPELLVNIFSMMKILFGFPEAANRYY